MSKNTKKAEANVISIYEYLGNIVDTKQAEAKAANEKAEAAPEKSEERKGFKGEAKAASKEAALAKAALNIAGNRNQSTVDLFSKDAASIASVNASGITPGYIRAIFKEAAKEKRVIDNAVEVESGMLTTINSVLTIIRTIDGANLRENILKDYIPRLTADGDEADSSGVKKIINDFLAANTALFTPESKIVINGANAKMFMHNIAGGKASHAAFLADYTPIFREFQSMIQARRAKTLISRAKDASTITSAEAEKPGDIMPETTSEAANTIPQTDENTEA